MQRSEPVDTVVTNEECRRGWRDPDLLLLVLVVIGIYFSRLTAMPLCGEESRWARVAQEMLDTGDWIVPRQQGVVFPDRPPLNSWCIALVSLIVGDVSPLAVRLPTVMATLLTTLLVYAYARTFLDRVGALAAGVVFATFPQILKLGRHAESDAILTLCISASLLVWHMGYLRGKSPLILWPVGYFLAALAALTKGPQGPVYFAGTIIFYLICRRDWRQLFSVGHLVGLLVFAAVLGGWQIPFYLEAGPEASTKVWSEEGTLTHRMGSLMSSTLPLHLVRFPGEFLVHLLPWSILIVAYFSRSFWQSLGAARTQVLFLGTALLISFPTCWLIHLSRPRYLMSMLPVVACLMALVIERCFRPPATRWWQRTWPWFVTAMAGIMVTIGIASLTLNADDWLPEWALAPSRLSLGIYGGLSILLAAIAFRVRSATDPVGQRTVLLTIAAFVGLTYNVPIMNTFIQASPNTPAAVAELKQSLPPGQRLVSYGPLYHLFTYCYRDPIEIRTWPNTETLPDDAPEYFCFMSGTNHPQMKIPFAWVEVAAVSCDRYMMAKPRDAVVIGRRVGSVRPANTF